jgi:CRISPR-associated protein Cas1
VSNEAQASAEDSETPVPARMLNELTYCPRLYYLEHVAGEWAESADTIDGRRIHRRVDRPGPPLAAPEADVGDRLHARSVSVEAPRLGVVAKIDLVEAEGGEVAPVDYKRGTAPDPTRVPGGVWPADRIQVLSQALALREAGYVCSRAVVYYAGSRTRVDVAVDESGERDVREAVAEARRLRAVPTPPPPLIDSPKCPRCSLVGICLPDETRALSEPEAPAPRRLVPGRDDRLPAYVQANGATVGLAGDTLEVRLRDGERQIIRLRDTSQLCLFGAVQLTAAAAHDLLRREIPVALFTHGGWHSGWVGGFPAHNVASRVAQFAVAADPGRRLPIARAMVTGKILNARTLLRRNSEEAPEAVLRALKGLAADAESAGAEDTLLGLEGTAARHYFGAFANLLRPRSGEHSFHLDGRNRRPPRDPVNALLSFAYALLVKDARIALCAVGLDPMVGLFHRIRPGRPSLALDLMEEFRPLIADSVVLTAINTEVIRPEHFVRATGAVALTERGRRAMLAAYERRMDQVVGHPIFGYSISYRRILEVQARLLARTLNGELATYPSFRTR